MIKDLEDFDGYQVTDDGRVYSKKTKRWLKPFQNEKGYLTVTLYLGKHNKKVLKQIHRLVAETYIPNPNHYPQVNHKDECKSNNTVWINEDGTIDQEKSNLEWCTNEYNVNYGTRNVRAGIKNSIVQKGRKPTEQCRQAQIKKCSKKVYKFTMDGTLAGVYSSVSDAAKINNMSRDSIGNCCRGERTDYNGYKWTFA